MSQTISQPLSPGQSASLEEKTVENDDYEVEPRGDAVLSPEQIIHKTNLAELIDDETLARIGKDARRHIEIDEDSRSEWFETSKEALDLAMQVATKKSYPHDRASNVVYPLITVAAIQFAQRCYPALVPSDRVVNCVVIGDDTGKYETQVDPATGQQVIPKLKADGNPDAKAVIRPGAKGERATRIAKHMSWQCLHLMPEWEPSIDQLLHYLPIAGCAFRKMTYDASEKRPAVEWFPGDKFIINNNAESIKTAPRFSIMRPFYPFKIREKMMRREWIECEVDSLIPGDGAEHDDDQAPRTFYEHHCRLDLDGSGYEKPYIVTLHKEGKVVRIETNWREVKADGTIDPRVEYVKYSFIPNPKGGFYDVGFGWLLKNLNFSINTAINQMFDAGQWQNAPSGFLGRGIRMGRAGEISLKPNMLKKVDSSGEELAKNIFIYQHPGPSQTMFQLLGLLIDAGQSISSVQDIMQGKMDQNMAPTVAVTLVEQGMTTFTSIFKRVHRGAKEEFKILYDINAETLPEHMYAYGDVLDDPNAIAGEDYSQKDQDVMPVTDPRMVSDQVKRAKAGFLLDMAGRQLINQREASSRMLDAYNIAEPEKLLPPENPPPNPMNELALARMQLDITKEKQTMENERLDRAIKADEARAKILELRAKAVRHIAEAEAAEDGQQLSEYQAMIDGFDRAIEFLPPGVDSVMKQIAPPEAAPGAPPAGAPV